MTAWRVLLPSFTFAMWGCSHRSGPADAAPPAVDAAPSAIVDSAAPPPSNTTCSLERGFRGTIGPKAEVLARLERAGTAVTGHYLYTRIGSDLPLTGTLDAAGVLTLAEGDAQNPTGRFDGQCSPDGHLRGTWQKPQNNESLAFDLAPIELRDEMIVATRRKIRRFPPRPRTTPHTDGGFEFDAKDPCTDEVRWPEIFGARSPQDERAINKALTNDAWVFTEPGGDAQLRKCVIGERAEGHRTFEILLNRNGLFAVREVDSTRFEGTHPWDPGPESWLAFDTRSGATIAKRDLLPTAKPAAAALTRLLDRCTADYLHDAVGDISAAADMKERVTLDNLALLVLPTDKGLHFAANGYPPALRVLEGEGPTIAWSALLTAGALPPGSDGAARAWAGVAPAKPGDDPCVKPAEVKSVRAR